MTGNCGRHQASRPAGGGRRNRAPEKQAGFRPAFAYDRISDEIQADGISLDFQNSHSGSYAKINNIKILKNYTVVESASKEGRKAFNEMIDQAEKQGIRDLIFKNTDRMSRNYQDLVRIEKLIEKGFNIHFYQSNLVINKESSYNDRFLIGIQLAVAKHTSDKISQDIREHNRFKAAKGIAPGQSPFGYKYDTVLKKHVLDPKNEANCRYFFDEFDRGEYSLREYAAHLSEKGILTPTGKQWRTSNLHYILTNPFYHGEFWYQDRLWPGGHEAYYSKARYEDRLKRLGDGFRGHKKRVFQFRLAGLAQCSCGRIMTGEIKKGKYVYYGHRCADSGKLLYVPEYRLFEMLDVKIRETCFSRMFAENLKRIFKQTFEKRRHDNQTELDRITAKLKGIDDKRGRLIDLYTDASIDRETLNLKMSELNSETDKLDRYRAALGQDTGRVLSEICVSIDVLRDEPAALVAALPDRKPILLKNLAAGIIVNGSNLQIRWKPPYSFLMRPALLEARISAHEEGKKERLTSSGVSSSAPPVGQIQNAINDIIEEFVLFVNQEYPLKKAAGDTSGPVTVAPPVHVPDREPERLKILKDRKELKILYVSENLSRNAIAHRLKVSHSAVGEALKRFGIVKKEKPRSRHPGQIPFGWDWNDIKLVKNQKEQKTIRWIGQMEKTGKSLREIAKVLNESNVPAKNGGVWQANTVRVLLNRQ